MFRAHRLLAALLLAAPVPGVAAPTAPDPGALVEAEHAFAKDAAETSVRDAFVKWLAPSAVVFNPGPVNGHAIYEARKPSGARLTWEPVHAVMSAGGDLGWTTGPWEWRSDASHADPQAYGHYVTMWKRQADGTLRAVLDMGVSHDAPGPKPSLEARALAGAPSGRGPLATRKALWKADADYGRSAESNGAAAALAAVATPDVWLLRDGTQPVVGREAARDTVSTRAPHAKLMSLAQYVADQGDLGYTYGTLVAPGAAGPDSSYYLHIWQREAGQPWRLALELVQPLPHRKP